MKNGLIFDMDGTLWDSSANVALSWDIAVKRCGVERDTITEEDMKRVMGKTMDEIADILFCNFDKATRMEIMDKCCEFENEYLREKGGILYDELEDTLIKLKEKYHLYIVSNCQSGYIEAFLDHYNLWYLFEDIECFGNNSLPKADNIKKIYERNNLDKAYYVGDIQGDYNATVAAGLEFIHAAYGFGTIDKETYKIAAFKDLPELCEKIF